MTNPFPPNPALIHIIQDALAALPGGDMISIALRNGAGKDIDGALQLAKGLIEDNKRMAVDILGKELMEMITEFTNQK